MSQINEYPHDAIKVGEAQLVVTVGLDEQVFNSIVDDFYQDEDDGGDDEPDQAA